MNTGCLLCGGVLALLAIVAAAAEPPAAEAAAAPRATPPKRRPPAPKPAQSEVGVVVNAKAVDPLPLLDTALAAFNAGDLAAAEAAYGRVLAAEPANADALHGLAAIAVRQGRDDDAIDFHQRALAADPRDAVALAGLGGLHAVGGPSDAESRLRQQLAARPEQHVLHFALGNVYADAGRWHEAHGAYQAAHAGDPQQPDYLFNLAVALEHLHCWAAAAQHYERALAAAAKRLAAFDLAAATARLRELRACC